MVSVSSSPADFQDLLPGFTSELQLTEEHFIAEARGLALGMLPGAEGFSPGSSRHSLLILEDECEEHRTSVSLLSCALTPESTPTRSIRTDATPTSDLPTGWGEDPEIVIDESWCAKPPVQRRHSTSEPVESLVHLHQRRSSLVTLPSLAPDSLAPPPEESRKLSDPAVRLRNERVRNTYIPRQKRCLSDSEAPNFSPEDDDCKSEDYGSSALDSGYHDSRFPDPPASSRVSLDNFSEDYSFQEPLASPSKMRRPTPYSPFGPKPENSQISWPIEEPHSVPAVAHKRSLPSRQSQSSIATSSESISVSSFWESQISQVSAVDFLSSLGFDDYDSPQLVPDRFIPKDVEHVKPSVMKTQSFDDDESYCPSKAPSISTMSESSVSSTTMHRPPPLLLASHDLPLGATAETFSLSPPPETEKKPSVLDRLPSSNTTQTQTFYRYNTVLETVPEETASDLSPSPRWLSPRVSIDHSLLDFADGKLGGNLKIRKRSLPTRDGYRLSIGSQVESETGDSIHVSVTSYDDEMALEKEREKEELAAPIPVEDSTQPYRRARRKGVYVPPASVLTWLQSQETISEEQQNPEELPWPFNEQAKLRVSLTEIQMERDGVRLLEEPGPTILDHSRSPSPYGQLSACSSQRSPSPVQQADSLVPPKRRSRSLSPIVPPRIEVPARLRTTDDIHLRPSALCPVKITTEDCGDIWPHSELISHEAVAVETGPDGPSIELPSNKLLSRQSAIYEDDPTL